jgi:ketosteroid isomerase-like protein
MNPAGEQPRRAEGEAARSEPRILRMTPDGLTGSSIEVTLRRRIEELAQAIRDKDIERLMTFYARDVVVFDVRPPLETQGLDAYRQNFERWFGAYEGPLGFDFKELRVVPGEYTAFCHYLAMVVGAQPGHVSGYWVRGTTCFERRDGEWLVTHEHISMPTAK